MKKTILACSLLMVTLPTLSLADEIYIDGSIGRSEAESGPWETDDTYFRVGAGLNLLDNVSVEAGFWDLGSDRDRGVEISADAFYAAVKAQTDIAYNLKLFGRLGLMRWDADIGSDDDDGHDLFFGGGIGFQAGPGVASFEIHFMEFDQVDINTFGVSYTMPISF